MGDYGNRPWDYRPCNEFVHLTKVSLWGVDTGVLGKGGRGVVLGHLPVIYVRSRHLRSSIERHIWVCYVMWVASKYGVSRIWPRELTILCTPLDA